MKHYQSGRRRLWLPAAVLAALSFVGAGAALAVTEGQATRSERPSAASAPVLVVGPVAPTPAPASATPAEGAPTPHPAAGFPQRVQIASLDIDAPVLRIATDGSTLEPPSDPQDLGWWAQGAAPGAARGSALITGHTVHDGGGALDDLETLKPGTEIRVRTADGAILYVAKTVEVLDKDTIAREAPRLFSQQVDGRLVLVTCEDWDGTGYRSNVVVTARPAS